MKNWFSWIAQSIVLGSLLAGSVAVGKAIAEPSFEFKPVLQELKQKVPSGWTMRLPARLNFYDRERNKIRVYPDNLYLREGVFWIGFSTQPGCQAMACMAGGSISASPIGAQVPAYMNLIDMPDKEEITLTSGIRAAYSSNCSVNDPRIRSRTRKQSIQWQQDGMNYWVSQGCLSKSDVLDMASSMSSESPVVGSSQVKVTRSKNQRSEEQDSTCRLGRSEYQAVGKPEFTMRFNGRNKNSQVPQLLVTIKSQKRGEIFNGYMVQSQGYGSVSLVNNIAVAGLVRT